MNGKILMMQYRVISNLIIGIPSSRRSVNTIYIVLTSILATSIALSLGIWFRLLKGLMKSPKSKIIKFSDHSPRLNETSLYRLRKEVQFSLKRFKKLICFFLIFRLVNYHTSLKQLKPF